MGRGAPNNCIELPVNWLGFVLIFFLTAIPTLAVSDKNDRPDIKAGLIESRLLIEAKDYEGAKEILLKCLKEKPQNASVLDLLGYTSRLTLNLGDAANYYAEALENDPKHLGALEHQGELFLETGRIHRAKSNLDKIRKICGVNCEEFRLLSKAIRESQLN